MINRSSWTRSDGLGSTIIVVYGDLQTSYIKDRTFCWTREIRFKSFHTTFQYGGRHGYDCCKGTYLVRAYSHGPYYQPRCLQHFRVFDRSYDKIGLCGIKKSPEVQFKQMWNKEKQSRFHYLFLLNNVGTTEYHGGPWYFANFWNSIFWL